MTDLSSAAQAVLDAAFSVYDCEALYSLTEGQHAGMIAAAALRAVADQHETVMCGILDKLIKVGVAAPGLPYSELDDPEILKSIWNERRACRAELLAIATELEALPND